MWGTSQGFGADVTDELASALAGLRRPLVLEVVLEAAEMSR